MRLRRVCLVLGLLLLGCGEPAMSSDARSAVEASAREVSGPRVDRGTPASDAAKAAPDAPRPTVDVPMPADAPKPAPDAPKPAPDAPKPTPDAPKPTPDAPKPAPDAPKPTPDAPKPTPDAPKPAPDAPKPTPDASAPPPLVQVTSFGSNPGGLKLFKLVPTQMPASAPLLVVLHGCQMDAATYATASGWSTLAQTRKFYVAYAEQQLANNTLRCFNWFLPTSSARGQGEALSIKQMIDKMKADHSIDAQRVYVTGFSAGGTQAANLMADYPELIAGGAIMSGIPAGCAGDIFASSACMSGTGKTPAAWSALVKAASPGYVGPYPRAVLFHGTADAVVAPMNLTELVEQWTAVHGADQVPELQTTVNGHTVKAYEDTNGTEVVRTYLIAGMPHGISVYPGSGPGQGGQTNAGFAFDEGLWSSYYAALFLGL